MTKEAEAAEEGREETKERAEVKHFVFYVFPLLAIFFWISGETVMKEEM